MRKEIQADRSLEIINIRRFPVDLYNSPKDTIFGKHLCSAKTIVVHPFDGPERFIAIDTDQKERCDGKIHLVYKNSSHFCLTCKKCATTLAPSSWKFFQFLWMKLTFQIDLMEAVSIPDIIKNFLPEKGFPLTENTSKLLDYQVRNQAISIFFDNLAINQFHGDAQRLPGAEVQLAAILMVEQQAEILKTINMAHDGEKENLTAYFQKLHSEY